ncbi:MAG TPA: hypothetical protein VNS50_00185 [Ginsengibacter sp.]|nr:hypothetical protein [Ginsengibacter sp.]
MAQLPGTVRARTKGNEITWIFFSLLACNSMQITKRMQAQLEQGSSGQLKL